MQSDIDTIRGVLTESRKTRDVHCTVIGAANLVFAALIMIAVPAVFVAMGIVGATGAEAPPGEPSPVAVLGAVGVGLFFLLGFIALPFILAGWGLLKGKSWGKGFAIVTAVLNVLALPLGTALSIYTFWAFSKGKLG